MRGLRPAPFAIFFKLNFALNKFLVLARPVIYPLAFSAGQFDESVL